MRQEEFRAVKRPAIDLNLKALQVRSGQKPRECSNSFLPGRE